MYIYIMYDVYIYISYIYIYIWGHARTSEQKGKQNLGYPPAYAAGNLCIKSGRFYYEPMRRKYAAYIYICHFGDAQLEHMWIDKFEKQ